MSSRLIPFLDVTYLEDKTNSAALLDLCEAIKAAPCLAAAICVYQRDLMLVKSALKGYQINFACVINFPSGNSPVHQIQTEIKEAIDLGATELDVVAPYRQFLVGDKKETREFITFCRDNIPREILFKLILETGEINDAEAIYQFSLMACESGVDFIKTSTGKVKQGASLEATQKMLLAIKDYYQHTNKCVGIKVSGGIRSIEDAVPYVEQFNSLLRKDWLVPELFRIGASQLFHVILKNSASNADLY